MLLAGRVTGQQRGQSTLRPLPTPAQLRWQDAGLGVLVSYDLHTFGDGRYVQRQARVTPIDDVDRFAPQQLDTDQWIRAVKAAGARFAILTASHESGFRLWQSDANPYCLKAVRWGDGARDIVGEFHASCEKYDVLPGIYLGTRWNAQLGVYDFRVTERSTITQADYNRLIEREIEEICTRYGDWFEFWFDGGAHGPDEGGPDVLSIVERHQPDAVFYHNLQRADARWGGSESGTVAYPCWATFPYPVTGAGESARRDIAANGFALLKRGDPDGAYWLPAMSDAPLRGHGGHEWFWEPDDERLLQPLDALVDMYCRSVGHNSTLILGVTPDTRGLLPDADVARLREFGAEIERMFGTPLAQAVDRHGDVVELPLPARAFDTVVMQEDIADGERVRRYELRLQSGGEWRTIGAGTCVGHQRIQRFDEPLRGSALRLVVVEATGEARIRLLAAHATRATPVDVTQFADSWRFVGPAVREPDYNVWGSSPIDGPDGRVHLFVSRWPVAAKFDPGWRTHSEIARYVADRAEGPFSLAEVVVRGDGEGWDGFGAHNPTVSRCGAGYLLHYIANDGLESHPANQRIGALYAEHLEGPWRAYGPQPVLSPLDGGFNHNSGNGVNNPAYLELPDGRALLYFKTTDTRSDRAHHAVMGVAIAARPGASYRVHQEPVTQNDRTIEDGYAFLLGDRIALLTTDNHGLLEKGGGLLWLSRDGVTFDPTPLPGFHRFARYLADPPAAARTHYGAGWKFERPQLLLRGGRPAYLYVASGTSLSGSDGTCSYVLRFEPQSSDR